MLHKKYISTSMFNVNNVELDHFEIGALKILGSHLK